MPYSNSVVFFAGALGLPSSNFFQSFFSSALFFPFVKFTATMTLPFHRFDGTVAWKTLLSPSCQPWHPAHPVHPAHNASECQWQIGWVLLWCKYDQHIVKGMMGRKTSRHSFLKDLSIIRRFGDMPNGKSSMLETRPVLPSRNIPTTPLPGTHLRAAPKLWISFKV